MVDGARLESVCRLTPTVGSNPTLTAIRVGATLAKQGSDDCRDPPYRAWPPCPSIQARTSVSLASTGLSRTPPAGALATPT